MAPFLTILRLLLVVSGLAALGYAPAMARSAQGETVSLTEARIAPAAPSVRAPLPEMPKGDLPDLVLPAAASQPPPPQSHSRALVLPEAPLLASRPAPAWQARAPPLA